MVREDICATIAGGACVAGISFSVINAWLMAGSLIISIVAGVLAIRAHFRNRREEP